MNKLNKRIHSVDNKGKNRKLNRLHNTNKDLKYWDYCICPNENGVDEPVYVLTHLAAKQYEIDTSNTMKIPNRVGVRRGKK